MRSPDPIMSLIGIPSGVWGFAVIAVDSDSQFRPLGMLDTGSVETSAAMAVPNVSLDEVDIDADGKLDVVIGLHSGATLVVFHRGGRAGWWPPVGPKAKR